MPEEYFIAFFTEKSGAAANTVDAVRVRIDMINISDRDKQLAINLVEHPLYSYLEKYVKSNPSKVA